MCSQELDRYWRRARAHDTRRSKRRLHILKPGTGLMTRDHAAHREDVGRFNRDLACTRQAPRPPEVRTYASTDAAGAGMAKAVASSRPACWSLQSFLAEDQS